jgi:signal peptidase I
MSFRSVRKGTAAFLLSILTPGLGQIYNGQLWKGVLAFAGLLGFLLVSMAVGLAHRFVGLIVHIMLGFSIYMFVLGDAVVAAVRQVRMDRRPVHTWRSYALAISLLLITIFGVPGKVPGRIPGVRAYRMPAESMLPTLASEDRIVADTRYYSGHAPRRGDLIIFKFPYQDHPDYIKRVIGVPGDRIRIVDQLVYLNGQKENEPFAYHDSVAPYDPLLYNFPPAITDELPSSMQPEWAEQIFSYVHGGEMIVPPDEYFVLGDNRGHSWDSRYWGPIARNNIFGKALYIYWSKDKSRIGRTIR